MKKWLVVLCLSLSSPALAQSWNHDPASPIGPTFWGTVTFPFATCGSANAPGFAQATFVEVGKKQSPVDIVNAQPAALPAPFYVYGNTPFEVENTGHVIEVPYAAGSSLRIGTDTFNLVQFHFHTDSEHTVNGRPSPMEVHLVHQNALGNLAVVGILLEVGPNPNLLIEEIFANAPVLAGTTVAVEGRTLNARDLLPRNAASFWTYSGSLTTPPCSEGVKWTVLKNTVQVSQRTVDRFKAIVAAFPGYGGFKQNNRPVRPLDGRAILSN
ncbi:MAG TPA: carbonic anhydrase family protein [Anaeromyxobacteraceae bacterium]|nr:carbonic anhydrase family protein [Anaeromyxobacteraceae bacterium]